MKSGDDAVNIHFRRIRNGWVVWRYQIDQVYTVDLLTALEVAKALIEDAGTEGES